MTSRLVNYTFFNLNKFVSLSIMLCYNAKRPLITFEFALLHTLSRWSNPYLHIIMSRSVHSHLEHAIIKFLNIGNHYSTPHVTWKQFPFWSFVHIWPLRTIIKVITYLYFVMTTPKGWSNVEYGSLMLHLLSYILLYIYTYLSIYRHAYTLPYNRYAFWWSAF